MARFSGQSVTDRRARHFKASLERVITTVKVHTNILDASERTML